MTSPNILRAYRLLVTHREETARHRIKEILKKASFRRQVVAVESGRAAIEWFRQDEFDILITGTELTDTDGWRLISMVRSGRFCPKTLPVIALCEDKWKEIDEPLAQEHHAYLLPLSHLLRLPAIVADCINGYAKTGPTILIIDDDAQTADLIKSSLGLHYSVELAYDGLTGLAAWEAHQHRLVLLDLFLPGLPGWDVLKQIKEAKRSQPVIVITGYGNKERHTELILAGASDFLDKPFPEPDVLRECCERIMRVDGYSKQHVRLQCEERRQEQIDYRLWVADACLSSGLPSEAAQHLKHALAAGAKRPPTDDDWMRLLSEFDENLNNGKPKNII